MSSSDREGGGGNGQRGGKPARSEPEPEPPGEVERSIRGRIIIRSSSHPPPDESAPHEEQEPNADATPASEGLARRKRDTPRERPRGRREARAVQAASGELPDRATGEARPSGWQRTAASERGESGAGDEAAHAQPPASSSTRLRVWAGVALVVVLAIAALLLVSR